MNKLPDIFRSSFPSFRNSMLGIQGLQRQIDRLFEDFATPLNTEVSKISTQNPAFIPTCDVEETDSHYLMSFDLPGVKKEDIHVDLRENELTVSGERKEEREEKNKNRTRSERFYGVFERTFVLPRAIQADKVDATYSDGVLRLAVPKADSVKAQKITVGDGKPSAWDKSKAVPVQDKKSAH